MLFNFAVYFFFWGSVCERRLISFHRQFVSSPPSAAAGIIDLELAQAGRKKRVESNLERWNLIRLYLMEIEFFLFMPWNSSSLLLSEKKAKTCLRWRIMLNEQSMGFRIISLLSARQQSKASHNYAHLIKTIPKVFFLMTAPSDFCLNLFTIRRDCWSSLKWAS